MFDKIILNDCDPFILGTCNRQNNALPLLPPKDVHILTPRTRKYVILHGKRDFAEVIKDLETGRLSWIIQAGPR